MAVYPTRPVYVNGQWYNVPFQPDHVYEDARTGQVHYYEHLLVPPHPTNHVLHALLTFFTCGMWAPVWIICWAVNQHRGGIPMTRRY